MPLLLAVLLSLPDSGLGLAAERAAGPEEPIVAAKSAQVNEGLVAHWRLDEATGSQAFDMAFGYLATLEGGATWTAGRYGAAAQLDSSTAHLAPPPLDVYGDALTLAAWVNIANFPAALEQRIISKADGTGEQAHYWMLSQVRSGGRNLLRLRLKTAGVTSTLVATTGNLPARTWFHAAATYDGATMRLFLNGVLVGALRKTGALDTSPAVRVNIGRNPDGSHPLRGAVDDVRIYSRALTAVELAAVMEDSGEVLADTVPPTSPTGLIATPVSPTQMDLQWTPSTDDTGVTAYKVTRNGVPVSSVAGTSWSDRGVVASTTYRYAVSSVDAAGNESAPSPSASATTPAPDTAGPRITNVSATALTESTATITWMTDEPSTTTVEYGPTTAYGSASHDERPATAHAIMLVNLHPATTYQYRVVSTDGAGNVARSGGLQFRTAGNLPPTVSLTSPATGASYPGLATVSMSASASDPENRLAQVEFYAGGTRLARLTAAPFAYAWTSAPAGTHLLTAVARDAEGASTTSALVAINVAAPATASPWTVAFTASADHETAVNSYVLEVYAAGADPNSAPPVAGSDLGKPVLNAAREILLDRTAFFTGLPPGSYAATVRAVGTSGSTRSAVATFTR